MVQNRSVTEITARCRLILAKSRLVQLVNKCSSPTAAYTILLAETKDSELAKSGRWLAILKRDHAEEYQILVEKITQQGITANQERK